MIDGLRLWRRGLHESMAELGRAGRRKNRGYLALSVVLIVLNAIIIVRVAGRNGDQAVLMLTLEWGA